MAEYAIKTKGCYVFGFNKTHQIVQVSSGIGLAKYWKRKGYAEKFVAKYSDAGYGLNSEDCEIVNISGELRR